MINRQRLVDEFVSLVGIDSLSKGKWPIIYYKNLRYGF